MGVKHAFQSTKPDGADASLVRPSNWNAEHQYDLPVAMPAPGTGGGVTVTNVGTAYDAVALSQNLGFVEVYLDGVDAIEFTVKVNKVGTGVQSWQLWNDTDGAQVGVIDDAGLAGQKYLSVTIAGLALAGKKRLRVRAKSTTAGDDPVYYGAALILRQTG